MNYSKLVAGALVAAGLTAVSGGAQAQSLPATGTIAVPTYESVGLYWQSPGGTAGCEVKFRKSGEAAWKQGLAMWYDARDSQCRGSLVHLSPNTQYEVQFNLPGQAASRGLTFRTWANQVPVAKTITVNAGSGTFNVAESGSPSGYVVYDGRGATLDGGNSATYNVTINASYVVVRGLNLRGARQDAIRISPNVTDVIIEDNDISGWGRQRSGNWGVDMDSAIRSVCTQPTLQRVTIQRNRISNPRYSANSWSDGHPAGPQAIAFAHCGGNHVFRHNEIFSTNGNYFNDILGGEDNFTKNGFPNADTDIYGNKLSHAWDDAIEAEGANENVRIWGNYIDSTAIGIATTATSVGPAYIFRNVWNRARMYERIASLDSDDRQPFFKSGGTLELGHGRRYIMHNTMLQARQSGLQYGLGGGFGLGGTGSAQLVENTVSRNNIYHQWKDGKGFTYQTGTTSSFAHDMYNGHAGDTTVTNGIAATPTYASGHGAASESGGNYQLAAGSRGYDAAVRIPNFNDAFTGAAPDVGAHEGGTAAMGFGVAASPGSAVGAASTPPPAPGPGSSTATLSNISTRGVVRSGNDVLIGGFVIGGSTNKTVIVRARGPSLLGAGVANALADPVLQLVRSSDQATLAVNDNWGSAANATNIQASGFAPGNSLESAILVSLPPGAYTAIVTGAGGGTGVGIVEIFELDNTSAPLVNISTRGQVLTGGDVMIGGFVIQGSARTVVVRARGPSLAQHGITNPLANPVLQLVRSSDQATIASNDNWGGAGNAAQIQATGLAPQNSLEAAILVTLQPGAYTAIVTGAGGGTGIGIVEVFAQ